MGRMTKWIMAALALIALTFLLGCGGGHPRDSEPQSSAVSPLIMLGQ